VFESPKSLPIQAIRPAPGTGARMIEYLNQVLGHRRRRRQRDPLRR
jgi:hypothetical protein